MTMKQYERDLKKLIEMSEGGCYPVHQSQTGMSEADLRFLAAKGFVSLHPAGNDEFWLVVEPSGLAHFSNKSEAREAFAKDKIVTFLSGFASGVLVTIVATWIIQTM